VQLIILLLTSKLVLNAELNELEKQVVALKIKIDKQDAEIIQLKSTNDVQNEKISLLNKLNKELQQEFMNHSAMIDELQNSNIYQQQQLVNLTYLTTKCLQSSTELDGSGFQQDIYELYNISNNQQRQIQFLMDQKKELSKIDTQLQQIMQAEVDTVDIKFLNITDDHYKQIQNLTKQNDRLQKVVQLNQNGSKELSSALSETKSQINEQKNEIFKIKSAIEDAGKCKWQRKDGISLSKLYM